MDLVESASMGLDIVAAMSDLADADRNAGVTVRRWCAPCESRWSPKSGGGNLFLIEGTDPASDFTPVSDTLTVGYARNANNNTAAISGSFESDLLGILGYYDLTNLPQYSAAVGEGSIIPAEGLLGIPGNLFIDVISDAAEVPAVPEPSTLVLLGTGLLVAAPRLRRHLAEFRLF